MANVLLAGGGTAGHVNPMLATAHELVSRGHAVVALGTAGGLEEELVARAGLEFFTVPKAPFPRGLSRAWLSFPGLFGSAVKAAKLAIDSSQADVVVGFGGYVSTPLYVAARRRGIPIVAHEANARPGLANRLAAALRARVAITFPGTPIARGELTGLPLRPEIAELAETLADAGAGPAAREHARLDLGWDASARTLLVTGGSLGAVRVNNAVVEAVPALLEQGIHVLHLTGHGKADAALAAREALSPALRRSYVVREYAHDMAAAFAAADVVLCRAGAATVCELSALGLPAIYVPLAHGNGEQALNARNAVDAGAAVLVPDAEINGPAVIAHVTHWLADGEQRSRAVAAARQIGIRDGAARVADMVEESLK